MHSSPKIDSVHWEEIFPASLGKVKVEICSTGRHKTLDIYQILWFPDFNKRVNFRDFDLLKIGRKLGDKSQLSHLWPH